MSSDSPLFDPWSDFIGEPSELEIRLRSYLRTYLARNDVREQLRSSNFHARQQFVMRLWMDEIIAHFDHHGVIPEYEYLTVDPTTRLSCDRTFGVAGADLGPRLVVKPSRIVGHYYLQGAFATAAAAVKDVVGWYTGYIVDDRIASRSPVGLFTTINYTTKPSRQGHSFSLIASSCLASAQINHQAEADCNTAFTAGRASTVIKPVYARDNSVVRSGKVMHNHIHIAAVKDIAADEELLIYYGSYAQYWKGMKRTCEWCCLQEEVGEEMIRCSGVRDCLRGVHPNCRHAVSSTWECEHHKRSSPSPLSSFSPSFQSHDSLMQERYAKLTADSEVDSDEMDLTGTDINHVFTDHPEVVYAAVNRPHPNLLKGTNDAMEAIIGLAESHQGIEVRAVVELCRVGEPCQLGLFNCKDKIAKGTKLMYYGGQVTSVRDPDMLRIGKNYCYSISCTRMSEVLDGRPVADMFRRPILRSQADTELLRSLPASAFAPDPKDYTQAEMDRFHATGKAFMANDVFERLRYGRPMTPNCKMVKYSAKSDAVIVLVATRAIEIAEELTWKYCNNEMRGGSSKVPLCVEVDHCIQARGDAECAWRTATVQSVRRVNMVVQFEDDRCLFTIRFDAVHELWRHFGDELSMFNKVNDDFAFFVTYLASLSPVAYFVRRIVGDGACLYRAVSDQLYDNQDRHIELRRISCAHRRAQAIAHPKEDPLWQDILLSEIETQRKIDEWGSTDDAQALAQIKGVIIEIYEMMGDEMRIQTACCYPNDDRTPIIRLSFHGIHYNSIRPIHAEDDIVDNAESDDSSSDDNDGRLHGIDDADDEYDVNSDVSSNADGSEADGSDAADERRRRPSPQHESGVKEASVQQRAKARKIVLGKAQFSCSKDASTNSVLLGQYYVSKDDEIESPLVPMKAAYDKICHRPATIKEGRSVRKKSKAKHHETDAYKFAQDFEIVKMCCHNRVRYERDNPNSVPPVMMGRMVETYVMRCGAIESMRSQLSAPQRQTTHRSALRAIYRQVINDHVLSVSAHQDASWQDRPCVKAKYRFIGLSGIQYCTRCYFTIMGMCRRTYQRLRLKQANSTDKINCLKHGNCGPSKYGPVKLRMIGQAIQSVIDDRGSNLPHLNNTIQIDGASSRGEFVGETQNRVKAKDGPQISRTTMMRAVSTYHPTTNFVTSRRTALGKCRQCIQYVGIRVDGLTKQHKEAATALMQTHIAQQALHRHAFYRFNSNAISSEGAMISIVMDGMDQSKTSIPHLERSAKNAELPHNKIHITGVLIAGGPIPAMVFYNTSAFANDTHLNIEVLFQVILKTHAENKRMGKAQPRHMKLSMDNASVNKCEVFFVFLSLLVSQYIFETIEVNYFLVGHGHNQIDQMFSRFSVALNKTNCWTLPQLEQILKSAYHSVIVERDTAIADAKRMDGQRPRLLANVDPLHNKNIFFCAYRDASGAQSCEQSFVSELLRDAHTVDHTVIDEARELEATTLAYRCRHCNFVYQGYVQNDASVLELDLNTLNVSRNQHLNDKPACGAKHLEREAINNSEDAKRHEDRSLSLSTPLVSAPELYVCEITSVHDHAGWTSSQTLEPTVKKFAGISQSYRFLVDKHTTTGVTQVRVRQFDHLSHGTIYDKDGFELVRVDVFPAGFQVADEPREIPRYPNLSMVARPNGECQLITALLTWKLEMKSEHANIIQWWRDHIDERVVLSTTVCAECNAFRARDVGIGSISSKVTVDKKQETIKKQQRKSTRSEMDLHRDTAACKDTRRAPASYWWSSSASTSLSQLPGTPLWMPIASCHVLSGIIDDDRIEGQGAIPASGRATWRNGKSDDPKAKRGGIHGIIEPSISRDEMAKNMKPGMVIARYSGITQVPFYVGIIKSVGVNSVTIFEYDVAPGWEQEIKHLCVKSSAYFKRFEGVLDLCHTVTEETGAIKEKRPSKGAKPKKSRVAFVTSSFVTPPLDNNTKMMSYVPIDNEFDQDKSDSILSKIASMIITAITSAYCQEAYDGGGTKRAASKPPVKIDKLSARGANEAKATEHSSKDRDAQSDTDEAMSKRQKSVPSTVDWDDAIRQLCTFASLPDDTAQLKQHKTLMLLYGPDIVNVLIGSTSASVAAVAAASDHSELISHPCNRSVGPSALRPPSPSMWDLQQRVLFMILAPQTSIRTTHVDGSSITHQPVIFGNAQFVIDIASFASLSSHLAASANVAHLTSLQLVVPSESAILSDRASTSLLQAIETLAKDHPSVVSKLQAEGGAGVFQYEQSSTSPMGVMSRTVSPSKKFINACLALEPKSPEAACRSLFLSTIDLGVVPSLIAVNDDIKKLLREYMDYCCLHGSLRLLDVSDPRCRVDRSALVDLSGIWLIPPSGFSNKAPQTYIKDNSKGGVVATPLHDEIADSSALNVMRRSSRGVAGWLGFNLAAFFAGHPDRRILIHAHIAQSPSLLDSHSLLRLLLDAGHTPQWVWQLPGTMVISPAGVGAAHMVLTGGEFVVQHAINVAITVQGIENSVDMWKGMSIINHNSSLYTYKIMPLLRMMSVYQLPMRAEWQEQLRHGNDVVMLGIRNGAAVYTRTYTSADDMFQQFCGHRSMRGSRPVAIRGCGAEILWKALDGVCISCYHHFHRTGRCLSGVNLDPMIHLRSLPPPPPPVPPMIPAPPQTSRFPVQPEEKGMFARLYDSAYAIMCPIRSIPSSGHARRVLCSPPPPPPLPPPPPPPPRSTPPPSPVRRSQRSIPARVAPAPIASSRSFPRAAASHKRRPDEDDEDVEEDEDEEKDSTDALWECSDVVDGRSDDDCDMVQDVVPSSRCEVGPDVSLSAEVISANADDEKEKRVRRNLPVLGMDCEETWRSHPFSNVDAAFCPWENGTVEMAHTWMWTTVKRGNPHHHELEAVITFDNILYFGTREESCPLAFQREGGDIAFNRRSFNRIKGKLCNRG